jgi:putative endonuclease
LQAPASVIPAQAGIQTVIRAAAWIPGRATLARNDGVVIPAQASPAVIPAYAGIQYARSMKQPCVYILASQKNGTLYVGVTSNLVQRVWQHKNDLVDGFTKKYGVHMLVWFEAHETMESAIAREKVLKGWRRAWKLDLIEATNPSWKDLYGDIV